MVGKLAAVLLLGLVGCSGPAAVQQPERTGTVQVRLTDHREAIGDFQSLTVEVESVALHPNGSPRDQGWIQLAADKPMVDLTQLTQGHYQPVVQEATVPATRYDALRLTLRQAAGILQSGGQVQVALPAGTAAIDLTVSPSRTSAVLIDLIVQDLRDHPNGGYQIEIRQATAVAYSGG